MYLARSYADSYLLELPNIELDLGDDFEFPRRGRQGKPAILR